MERKGRLSRALTACTPPHPQPATLKPNSPPPPQVARLEGKLSRAFSAEELVRLPFLSFRSTHTPPRMGASSLRHPSCLLPSPSSVLHLEQPLPTCPICPEAGLSGACLHFEEGTPHSPPARRTHKEVREGVGCRGPGSASELTRAGVAFLDPWREGTASVVPGSLEGGAALIHAGKAVTLSSVHAWAFWNNIPLKNGFRLERISRVKTCGVGGREGDSRWRWRGAGNSGCRRAHAPWSRSSATNP